MQPIVIKQSKRYLWLRMTGGAIGIILFFAEPFGEEISSFLKESQYILFLFVSVSAIILVKSAVELILRKPELVISNEGIELREQGYFSWDQLASFRLRLIAGGEDPDEEYLVLYLKNKIEITHRITNLEKKRMEIVDLIESMSNKVSYLGYEER